MQKLLGLILNKGQTLSQSQILGHYHIETLPHGDYHIGTLPNWGTTTLWD